MTLAVASILILTTAGLLFYMLRQKPDSTVQGLIQAGRYNEAVAESDRLLEDSPSSVAHLHRAEALKLLGRFQDSLESYRLALDLIPDDAAAREGFALMLARLGRQPEAARKIMEDTVAQSPQIQEFQALALSWILLRQGQQDEALRLFEDNRELLETRFEMDYTDPDPLLAETLSIYAELARAAGDPERAAELEARVKRFAPSSFFARRLP